MKNKSIRISYIGMFSAVIIVLSQLSIPTPSGIPFTLQTLAIALCAFVLGIRGSIASLLIYILMGAAGLPVFAGFRGGIGILFGYTGGFIFGFIPLAILCAAGIQQLTANPKSYKNKILLILAVLSGLFICHFMGAAWYAFLSKISFYQSLLVVSLPYIAKDIVMIGVAYAVSIQLRRFVI